MLIFLPVFLMFATALVLALLRITRSRFKYPWMLAATGAIVSLLSVFLWLIHFPQTITLPPWQPVTLFLSAPTWLADGTSWPYALALAALAAAVIWTSVVRSENGPETWAGTLVLAALGILAVAADNPLTLVLTWSVIDLVELVIMLRSTEGEAQNEGVAIAFAARLAGTGLVIWADLIGTARGIPLDFRSTPSYLGIFLLIAAGLRLGVLPLHLPYRKENVVRRGFGSTLRLVSAAASLSLLAHIPASGLKSPLTPYLLVLAAVTALYSGWMWLRASDEVLGRPFWVLGLASLAVADSLRGNPAGSIGWGVALILTGGLLFLFSARRRSILWLPFLGTWALSSLPFSPTASAWQAGNNLSWLYIIPLLPAQALLISGYLRHTLHPGETSLESQEKWVKAIYPIGLLILVGMAGLLGFMGWDGARTIGVWWLAVVVILLVVVFMILAVRFLTRLPPGSTPSQWTRLFGIQWLYGFLNSIYVFFLRLLEVLTGSLEGDGGLLWSFVLLVLILSILSTLGK
ncbi:MAG TPA: hypothetical protein VMC09_04130 [Anaerolineales bacterium]|nr:hypothetical protein [Anaerolineales bacterium]